MITPGALMNIASNAKNLRFLNIQGPYSDAEDGQLIRDKVFSARLESNIADGNSSLFKLRLSPLDL
jgi:hypothetical protein